MCRVHDGEKARDYLQDFCYLCCAGLYGAKKCRLAPRSKGLEHCRYSTVILVFHTDFLQEFSEILSLNSISGFSAQL